jgi:long-subunit acyl-CoA synthetase (AMP-forming)
VLGQIDAEMLWATYAAWLLGGATVSLWPGYGPDDAAELVEATTPRVAVVRGAMETEQLLAFGGGSLESVVQWTEELPAAPDRPAVLSYAEFRGLGEPPSLAALPQLPPDQVVSMYRTSGSTGTPKNAIHTQASLLAGTRAFLEAFPATDADDHVPNFNVAAPAEPVVGTVNHLITGMRLNFGAGRDTYDADVAEISPHYMWLMPYQWEARCAALEGSEETSDRQREALGASRTRWAITGGYQLADAAIVKLESLGLELWKIYASAEMLIVGAGRCAPGDTGGVGRLFPEVQGRLHDGELQISWTGLFTGYWNASAQTAAALDGAWYRTGDLADLGDDGTLTMLGRRDSAAASGASSLTLEVELRNFTFIQDAFCIPGSEPGSFLALISLRGGAAGDSAAETLVRDAMDQVNAGAEGSLLTRCAVLARGFQPGIELTPTGKLRRGVIEQHFAGAISALDAGDVVFVVGD